MIRATVILPAYNEEQSIAGVLDELKALEGVSEVIVVDDGSTDQTADIARAKGARVITQPYNKGNGAAVKTGIRWATGDVVVLMDADHQHNPLEIPQLLAPMFQYDMVIGSRGTNRRGNLHRNLANQIYNGFASWLTRFKIQDLTSGFRAIRTDVARKFLYLLPNGFSYPTTLTLSLLRSGYSIKYIPIHARKRVGKSKISLLSDGAEFFLIILKIIILFSPLRVFLPLSVAFSFTGVAYYGYTFLTRHEFSVASALFITTGVLLFSLGLISEQIAQLRMDRSEEFHPRLPQPAGDEEISTQSTKELLPDDVQKEIGV